MAIDKAVDSSILDGYFTNIANAIRTKAGTQNAMTPAQMPTEIANIPSGGEFEDYLKKQMTDFSSDVTEIKRIRLFNADDVLTSVSLPNCENMASAEYAFDSCINLTTFNAPSLYRLDWATNFFNNCTKLSTVNLDWQHLTSLPSACFYNCRVLATLPSVFPALTSVQGNAFSNCWAWAGRVEMPELSASLGQYNNIFSGCYGITHFSAHKHVTPDLRTACFANCTGLIFADCGKCTNQWAAFASGIQNLKCWVLRRTDAVTAAMGASLFHASSPIAQGTGYILVPRDLIATYQAATNWSTYYAAGTQFLPLEDYIIDPQVSSNRLLGRMDWDKIDALLA